MRFCEYFFALLYFAYLLALSSLTLTCVLLWLCLCWGFCVDLIDTIDDQSVRRLILPRGYLYVIPPLLQSNADCI